MSSWSSGRVHFRERKMPNNQINLPRAIENIEVESNKNDLTLTLPSKYINNSQINDAVICAIALDEELYIDEWIKYNLALGFSHIYIYDNSNDNSLKNKKSNKVTIIHFPGKTKQLEAYNIFTRTYKKKHKWCAFIDCDEFISLKKHNTIMDFLNEYNNYNSIAINWLMFGTSHKISYSSEPVTKRFQYCSSVLHHHIKCITKIANIDKYISPHYPELLQGNIYDVNNNIIVGPSNTNFDMKVICIHHYYTKSEEEFLKKIKRGKSDIDEKRSIDELNGIHLQNNDVFNSDAWDFYSKINF